jgi:hypothetical protein
MAEKTKKDEWDATQWHLYTLGMDVPEALKKS